MTREEKIISAMCDNLSTKGNVVSGLTKATTAISQLFDEEMIEFAECHYRWKKGSFAALYTTAELLQLFKNRYSPDKQ